LKITFLGTGTSQGVPVIGCDCEVCQSTDKKDKRLRTSAMIEWKGKTIIIDAGPDFRQQLLRAKVTDVAAILMTHEHNDHIIGMDDILKNIEEGLNINIEDLAIQPIRAWHGQLPVFGFRFNDFTYLTDVNRLEASEIAKVKGTKILALDALHHSKHHSHFNLEEALAFIEIIHRMGLTEKVNAILPSNVQLAYDGLILNVE